MLTKRAQPFRIHVEQRVLDDLQMRLQRTRWTSIATQDGWDFGTSPALPAGVGDLLAHEL